VALQVNVDPAVLTINQGNTVMVTQLDGSINYYILKIHGNDRLPSSLCERLPLEAEILQQQWYAESTKIATAQEEIYRLYQHSIEDMSALRLDDPDLADDIWIPAAGVPWFVYPDGSLVKGPIALCELQGYVFDAWLRMAEVFDVLGEPDRSVELHRKASELQHRFEHAFWCDDLEYYAFALDGDKQPVRSIASNPGHCLWSGIISLDRAQSVIRRLIDADMWSGWGGCKPMRRISGCSSIQIYRTGCPILPYINSRSAMRRSICGFGWQMVKHIGMPM